MKVITSFIFLLSFYSCSALTEEQSELARPKADFLQSKLNNMMQNTASWLDEIADNESEGASARGYLQLSWLPRTADLDDTDAKFKILLDLPNWNDRLSLIIDNDNEDELLLDYESDRTDEAQEGVNVAFQYIKHFNQTRQVKSRIGISRRQLYLRSEMQFTWQLDDFEFGLQPRIDYFLQDGWGPGAKGNISYQLENSYLALSASWQKIEEEARSRRKVGFYLINNTGPNQLLVSGIQYIKSNNKEDISNESYFISTRYRNLIYKSWMYFEIEPFIEFNQQNNFRREVGIGLSLISYYGG